MAELPLRLAVGADAIDGIRAALDASTNGSITSTEPTSP